MGPSELSSHRVLRLKFDPTYSAAHHVLFKPHRVRDPCPEKPNLRTLLLSNVPPWATRDAIKSVFSPNGAVDHVFFQKTATSGPPPDQDGDQARVGSGFKYAYVVFERPSSVKKAMTKMDLKEPRFVSSEKRRVELGLEKWRKEYNSSLSLDTEELEKGVEEGVRQYDLRKEEEKRKAEEMVEDDAEDGWTTVTRHTSKKPVGGGSAKAQAKVKAREAKKRKRKELENFYRAQMKEKKVKRMTELREKFEKDKQRQLQMKADRKFRPK